MRVLGSLRWAAFAVYGIALFATPPALLGGFAGLVGGTVLALGLFLWMRHEGTNSIRALLGAKPLTASHAPIEHALLREYCRRLQIAPPALAVIETQGLNAAVFGFSTGDYCIALTRGLLQSFSREQRAAILARALVRIANGEAANETWLARFFQFLHQLVHPGRGPKRPETPALALRRIGRQILLYPLTLFPAFVLRGSGDEGKMDEWALGLTGNRRALAEAFRRMEALSERIPYRAPFSTRHLFLAAAPTADPLARVFFANSGFSARVRAVEGRSTRTVASNLTVTPA